MRQLFRLSSYFLIAIVLGACFFTNTKTATATPTQTPTVTTTAMRTRTPTPTPVPTVAPTDTPTPTLQPPEPPPPEPEPPPPEPIVTEPPLSLLPTEACAYQATLTPEPSLDEPARFAAAAWNVYQGCVAIIIGPGGAEVVIRADIDNQGVAAAAWPGGPVLINPYRPGWTDTKTLLIHEFGHVINYGHDGGLCVMNYDCLFANRPFYSVY